MYLSEKSIQQLEHSSVPSVNDQKVTEEEEEEEEVSSGKISKQLNVEELEMLLEAYFVQIDGTLNKLSTLREYVDDTEDYINIMLDDKQNHLLQMGVMLTTATLVVSAFVVVSGIFGMNFHDLYLFEDDGHKDEVVGMERFLWTAGGGSAGTVFLFVAAIALFKHTHYLDRVTKTKHAPPPPPPPQKFHVMTMWGRRIPTFWLLILFMILLLDRIPTVTHIIEICTSYKFLLSLEYNLDFGSAIIDR